MTPLPVSLRDHAGRLIRFALVSGTGLAIDLLIFLGLVQVIPAFAANFISSCAAVTFVYFASVQRIFRYRGQFVPAMFGSYAGYQVVGILLGSWAVSALVHAGLAPAWSKIAILPVTFGCNYLFMWWLTSSPERWVRTK